MTTSWTCEQTEARLSDYLDGLLQPSEQAAFDAHVNTCERCTPLVAGVSHLLTNLHSMEELETPQQLVYAILDKTLGPRDSVTGWRAMLAWVRGLASPKFAYGAVSLAATFLLVASAAGFSWRKPKLADLRPMTIMMNADAGVHRAYARSTKFVSDLRVVYEIQARFSQSDEIQSNQESVTPKPGQQKAPGQSDATPATPKQQNRANGVERRFEVMAAEFRFLLIRRTL
jgi:anti-sigma factor RsiW